MFSGLKKVLTQPVRLDGVRDALTKERQLPSVGGLVKSTLGKTPDIKPFECAITSRLARDEGNAKKILDVPGLDSHFRQVYADLRAGGNKPAHISGQDATMRTYIDQARKHSEQAGSQLHFFAIYDPTPGEERVRIFDDIMKCDNILVRISDALRNNRLSDRAIEMLIDTLPLLEHDLTTSHRRRPITTYAYYMGKTKSLLDSIISRAHGKK